MQVPSSDVLTAPPVEPASTPATQEGRKILAFIGDEQSETALRQGLVEFTSEIQIRRGNLRNAVKALEKEAPPRVLIVDVAGIDSPLQSLESLARVCPPDVTVLVIGENADISFYRTLIYDLGVTEYLWKPLTRDNVARLFGPRIAGTAVGPVTERGGRIVVLCGARGGVGTTTVTVNTAMQLADTTRTHVALLDLHLQGGTVALMLGANPGPGLRIALESPERADSLFLDRVSIPVNDRLRLIAADEALEAILSPTPAGVTHVMELLKQKFNYVLVDLPMPPAPAMRGLLALARQTIIVMGPDVASVRDAQAIRRFVAAEAGADRTLTVLNRADMPGALTSSLIEKGLGRKPDAVIPDLGRPLLKAANLGTPAIHKSSALRKTLAPIVREIAAVHDAPVQRSWLSRLMGK